jgi:DTW domain-containing protein YfiP
MHRERCICAGMPSLDLKTKVTLVIHAKELKRTTNTGRLALKALVNSEMRVRGADKEAVDLSDLLTPDYRTILFYPSEDAVELTPEFVNESSLPIQLIVPDGSWRQASKVHYRHHELKDVIRVKITTPNLNPFHIRKETTEFGMATLEAIALALEIIEGDKVGSELKNLFQRKLEATLMGRGVL